MESRLRIVITGGHLAPALAVVESLPKNVLVLFIGRKYALEGDDVVSLEYRAFGAFGVDFVPITAGRLKRDLGIYTIISLFKFPFGLFQAMHILREFRPHVVLSFGGYVSLPVGIASFLLSIPVVVHEQTFGAGIANSIVSLFARKVCISWESSRKYFPKEKTVLTGNPVRKAIRQQGESSKPSVQSSNERLPLVYITGGSTGSHAINVLVEGCVEKLLQRFSVVHQTGDAKNYQDFERLTHFREKFDPLLRRRYTIVRFVDPGKVGGLMREAALVVSRAGINTVSELLAMEKPALLIPLPHGQKGEQQTNALFLQRLGLAEVKDQRSLTKDGFCEAIIRMVQRKHTYRVVKSVAKRNDAAERIIATLFAVGGSHAT